MIEGGALLPLGGDRPHGGHKGYCLSAMVDILCGVSERRQLGSVCPAVRSPHRNSPPAVSANKLAISLVHSELTASSSRTNSNGKSTNGFAPFSRTKPAPGTSGVLIPGDPEPWQLKFAQKKACPSFAPSSTTCETSPPTLGFLSINSLLDMIPVGHYNSS